MTPPPPLVSILMTAFNAERFITEAIDSVLQQTEQSWELLVVDDGSTDRTLILAQQFAAQRPEQIRVLQHPGQGNRGISSSRNLALAHARGSLLAFLDSDDVWLPHHLATLSAVMLREPSIAMAYGSAERWVHHEKPFDEAAAKAAHWGENYLPPMLPQGQATGVLPPGMLVPWFLEDESMVPCICSVMVRTETARQVNGFCDSFRGLYDDQVFHAKIALKHNIYALDTCLARYRQHANSCCHQNRENQPAAAKERKRFRAFIQSLNPPQSPEA